MKSNVRARLPAPTHHSENAMKAKQILTALLALISLSAHAELKVGDQAPMFTAQATQGGKVFTWSLRDALSHGLVVLYFYPAAFTRGCTIEAHRFAETIDQFKALGATVIGVSHDPLDKLQRFSVSECRSKFPVAADTDGTIMQAYDTTMPILSSYASRTSYVIAPNGRIVYVYSNMNPDKHVANTLQAIKQWQTNTHYTH